MPSAIPPRPKLRIDDLRQAEPRAKRSAFAMGRGAKVAVGGSVLVLGLWAGGLTWYFVAKDDVAASLLLRQSQMRTVYEERIGALRERIDQISSQKLVEQEAVAKRLAALASHQAQLEARHALLAALAERAALPEPSLAVAPARAAPAPKLTSAIPMQSAPSGGPDLPAGASAFAPAKPAPEPSPFQLRLRDDAPATGPRAGLGPDGRTAAVSFERLEATLSRIESKQVATLYTLLTATQRASSHLRGAVEHAGLDPDALTPPSHSAPSGVGGPLVPLDASAGPFERLASEVQTSLAVEDRLRRSVVSLPFGRPVAGEPEFTSPFGVRTDPFLGSPALHSGLDFRAEHGAPIRATGPGEVTIAEYTGGYGNMVEVNHGNGVSTRYAHLAAILVTPGQTIAAGDSVGRAGSTGRSTGTHLHYETRIDGEPVDPKRFLRAGERLRSGSQLVAER
jgi:murein DD-endopeptidase MepM/ murein hydrolase activator NlpD